MTAFTKTITDKLSLAGCTPATLWDDATNSKWDVAFWDDGTRDIAQVIGKLISESESIADNIIKFPTILRSEAETISDNTIYTAQQIIVETLAPIDGFLSVYKFDGTGTWNYDFPDFTKNFESMSTASFTAASNNSVNWSTIVTNTVGWS